VALAGAALGCTLSGAGCSPRPAVGAAPPGDAAAQVVAVETAWDDAIVRKHTAAAARVLAPDFVYVGPAAPSRVATSCSA
jgi:hypothetical protein